MVEVATEQDKYRLDFQTLNARLDGSSPLWLNQLRERGFSSFARLGFPTATRGKEEWKYTSVGPIAKATFEYPFERKTIPVTEADIRAVTPWDDGWTTLVFVDGHYSEALSSPGSESTGYMAAPLTAGLAANGDTAERHLGRYAVLEEDGFAAVNTAFIQDAALVRVPSGSSPEAPVHLVFVTTDRDRPIVTHPRILVVAEENSTLSLVESYIGLTESRYFTNAVVEIVVGEGASIDHYRYLMESPKAFHIGTTHVYQGRDSTFSSIPFAVGASVARNGLYVALDGSGSSCVLRGLYLTSGTQHIDNHINIDHAKPQASSSQRFKGILAGKSRAVFSGRVLVRQGAQKTYSDQSDKNLILSAGARVNTKPSLEIYADDVMCTHGATVGAVATEALFYMRSRGLDHGTALSLLIHGFASEIIETVKLEPFRDHLDRLVAGTLPAFRYEGVA